MSITITTDVFCDACGMAWVFGCTGSRPDSRKARRAAKTEGWERRGNLDVCPSCAQGARHSQEGR